MAGKYYQSKTKKALLKRFKNRSNTVFVDKAGKTLQKRAKKGYNMYYVIIDKKR